LTTTTGTPLSRRGQPCAPARQVTKRPTVAVVIGGYLGTANAMPMNLALIRLETRQVAPIADVAEPVMRPPLKPLGPRQYPTGRTWPAGAIHAFMGGQALETNLLTTQARHHSEGPSII